MLVASGGIARGPFVIPGERRLGVQNRPWMAAAIPVPTWIGKTDSYYGRTVKTSRRIDSATGVDLYAATSDHVTPGWSPERIQWLDDLQCQIVTPGQISPAGWTVAGASLRTVSWSMLSIESVVSGLIVDLLDDDGAVIETVAVDGVDPCRSEVVHPDPVVDPLRWSFSLAARDISGGEVDPVPGPGRLVLGRRLLDDWDDARYGSRRTYRTTPQILESAYAVAQIFATLTGPSDRYRVRISTGLEGYVQAGGAHNAARTNAERRN